MRFAAIVGGAVGLALALAGCSSTDNAPSDDNSLGLVKPGTLTVCGDSPYKPFEIEDSSSPSGYSGFDVDLTSAIADKLGLKYTFVDTDFDAVQSGVALTAKQCDIGASSITITEDRKQNLLFSTPYYDSLQSLLVPADSTIKGIDDLSGKRVGVQTGTTGEIYTRDNAPSDATVVSFPSDGEMWLAIQAGQVDALLQDLPVNHEHAVDNSGYTVITKFETDEQLGFVIAKDNEALLDAVNGQLEAMRNDGTYDTFYDKYFG